MVETRDTAGRDVRASLEPATVLGDARLTERLVANLLDNAIRHNVDPGWVEVRTETGEDMAKLTVTNTGPTIPPAELDHLFLPLTRLAPERTATGAGLGLGLPIVAAIVTAHDGRLDARPRSGGGLTVTVELPRRT